MDIKVNQAMPVTTPEAPAAVHESDGAFKFTLVSHIEEQELQARLGALMEEITMQGDKLAKKRDIRDMKKYRGFVGGVLQGNVAWINGGDQLSFLYPLTFYHRQIYNLSADTEG